MNNFEVLDGIYYNARRDLIGVMERMKAYSPWQQPSVYQTGIRFMTAERCYVCYVDLRHAKQEGWVKVADEPRGRTHG